MKQSKERKASDASLSKMEEDLKYKFNVRNCASYVLSLKEVALYQRLELLSKHYIEF